MLLKSILATGKYLSDANLPNIQEYEIKKSKRATSKQEEEYQLILIMRRSFVKQIR